jgi:hypothetical protein
VVHTTMMRASPRPGCGAMPSVSADCPSSGPRIARDERDRKERRQHDAPEAANPGRSDASRHEV